MWAVQKAELQVPPRPEERDRGSRARPPRPTESCEAAGVDSGERLGNSRKPEIIICFLVFFPFFFLKKKVAFHAKHRHGKAAAVCLANPPRPGPARRRPAREGAAGPATQGGHRLLRARHRTPSSNPSAGTTAPG